MYEIKKVTEMDLNNIYKFFETLDEECSYSAMWFIDNFEKLNESYVVLKNKVEIVNVFAIRNFYFHYQGILNNELFNDIKEVIFLFEYIGNYLKEFVEFTKKFEKLVCDSYELLEYGFSKETFQVDEIICKGIEKDFFKNLIDETLKIEEGSLSTEIYDLKKLSKLLRDKDSMFKIQLDFERGSLKFKNFHYFCPSNIQPSKTFYLPEIYENVILLFKGEKIAKNIVGALCLHCEGNKKTVSYIDIHKDFRQKGFAKFLYSELNQYLWSTDKLYGTDMSEMGKIANVHKLRKELVTVCEVF